MVCLLFILLAWGRLLHGYTLTFLRPASALLCINDCYLQQLSCSFNFYTGKLRRRQFYSQPFETGKVLHQGSTFTYQDILDELLVYTPDTHGSVTDEIHFSVTDGVHTEMGRLEFSMDVKKSEGPRVTINRGLQLAAGQYKVTLHYLMGYRVGWPFGTIRTTCKRSCTYGDCAAFSLQSAYYLWLDPPFSIIPPTY